MRYFALALAAILITLGLVTTGYETEARPTLGDESSPHEATASLSSVTHHH